MPLGKREEEKWKKMKRKFHYFMHTASQRHRVVATYTRHIQWPGGGGGIMRRHALFYRHRSVSARNNERRTIEMEKCLSRWNRGMEYEYVKAWANFHSCARCHREVFVHLIKVWILNNNNYRAWGDFQGWVQVRIISWNWNQHTRLAADISLGKKREFFSRRMEYLKDMGEWMGEGKVDRLERAIPTNLRSRDYANCAD